jgi:hypothetical protein
MFVGKPPTRLISYPLVELDYDSYSGFDNLHSVTLSEKQNSYSGFDNLHSVTLSEKQNSYSGFDNLHSVTLSEKQNSYSGFDNLHSVTLSEKQNSYLLPLSSDGPLIPVIDAEDIIITGRDSYCRPTQRLRSLELSTYNHEPFIRMPWYTGLRRLTVNYYHNWNIHKILLCTNLLSLSIRCDGDAFAESRELHFTNIELNKITSLRELTLENVSIGAIIHDELTDLVLLECTSLEDRVMTIRTPNLRYLKYSDRDDLRENTCIRQCPPTLTRLVVPYCKLTSDDISNLPLLEYIECHNIKGDLTHLTHLKELVFTATRKLGLGTVRAPCKITYKDRC